MTRDTDDAVFLSNRILITSATPGRIIDEIKVDLPHPRKPAFAPVYGVSCA